MSDASVTSPEQIDQMRDMIGAAPPSVIANTHLLPGGKVQFASPEAQAWFAENAQQYGHTIDGGTLAPASAGAASLSGLVSQVAPGVLPPGYSARVVSGDRPGSRVAGTGGVSQHSIPGHAIDVQIFDSQGHPIPNRGADTTGLYGKLAVGMYVNAPPEIQSKLAWGGNFTTGPEGGPADLMHFDLGGDRGRFGRLSQEAAGSGITPRSQVASLPQAPTATPTQDGTASPSMGISPELLAALTAKPPAGAPAIDTTQQAEAKPKTPETPTLNSPPPGHPATAFSDALKAIAARKPANPFS